MDHDSWANCRMLEALRNSALGLLLLMATTAHVWAQAADTTFFVIGKHASFSQEFSSAPGPVDFSFFAEIFLRKNGDASNAVLTLPQGLAIAFDDQRTLQGGKRDNVLRVSGKQRYKAFADLQLDYPDGEYRIAFATPGGSVDAAKLLFRGDSLPTAPTILLHQDGSAVCSGVDPAKDLHVSWSRFAEGGADPNGVLDDLIFVILEETDGTRIAHSGRPFEDRPYLIYSAEEFVIAAGTMKSDSDYTLGVEHAILDDTRRYSGIPAMTTRAVTTKMAISTAPVQSGADRGCGNDSTAQ